MGWPAAFTSLPMIRAEPRNPLKVGQHYATLREREEQITQFQIPD